MSQQPKADEKRLFPLCVPRRGTENKVGWPCGHFLPMGSFLTRFLNMAPRVTTFKVAAIIGGNPPPHEDMTLYLMVEGTPLVQERHRVRWMPFRGARPTVYDPCSASKRGYKLAVRKAMSDIGVTHFPLFLEERVKIKVTFFVTNAGKDIDNLLKFVMDALQGVIYPNDRMVFQALVKKEVVEEGQESTQIELMELV
jgi:Holliday junction resolvase RusA-like endonuclease